MHGEEVGEVPRFADLGEIGLGVEGGYVLLESGAVGVVLERWGEGGPGWRGWVEVAGVDCVEGGVDYGFEVRGDLGFGFEGCLGGFGESLSLGGLLREHC